MKAKNRVLIALAICWLILSGLGGLIAPASGHADVLAQRIDQLLADPSLNQGVQAVMVKSLQTGKVLYERSADLAMIPASNMKLIVSATALDQLGPDFTFVTKVFACGPVTGQGVIDGDIALVGGGDPVLETRDLMCLAKELRAKGIKKITGDVIVDDSLFDDKRLGTAWSWDDLSYYYSAEISALNLNRNVLRVWVYPGKSVGDPAVVQLDPPIPYIKVETTPITGESGSEKRIWAYRELGTNVIKVTGSIPVDAKVTDAEESITVHEPALYAGYVFRSELRKQGIIVLGEVKAAKLPNQAVPLCQHTSPALASILALLNKPSDNLIAEVLLRTLGAVVKGRGSVEFGREVEREFLSKIGVDVSGVSIADGSGLSRLNYVTARALVDLLCYMYRHKNADVFIASLPIAGVDGTLRNRMKGSAAEKNVRAKTGYVSRVSTLSGYLTTKSGEPLAFSILMNHHLCPTASVAAIQDKICGLLAELSTESSPN
jgi:D-alanyl-D-alanine carboxypeptidase/D-alanyl-D-alanine-endopeptidase (penicillin-binding protein 4)